MLKKNEVIEALENGGAIMIDTIYRTARVLDAEYNELGTCRYDTAERIERSEGYKTRKTDWYATRFVEKDWDAVSARVMSAVTETFRAMERAGVISNLTVEPMTAAECAELSAAAQEAPAEADPQNAVPVKVYCNERTNERTGRAAIALGWHRAGDAVEVRTLGAYWGELLRRVTIHGAPLEAKRSSADENREHCKHIALELDAYVNDEVRRCPDCGEIHRRDWDDVGDAFKCPHCGEIASVDDWEALGVYDFLGDCYDIEYRVTGRARDALRSVCIMVACGGPNIYLDTETKNVELYWWSERAWYPMSCEAVAALDEWAEEMWCCL